MDIRRSERRKYSISNWHKIRSHTEQPVKKENKENCGDTSPRTSNSAIYMTMRSEMTQNRKGKSLIRFSRGAKQNAAQSDRRTQQQRDSTGMDASCH